DATTFVQILLNNRVELIARPTAAGTNRLPTPHSYRRPVSNRNRLRTGNHDSIWRNAFQTLLVLLAHRAALDEFVTDWTDVDRKDQRQTQNGSDAGHKRPLR